MKTTNPGPVRINRARARLLALTCLCLVAPAPGLAAGSLALLQPSTAPAVPAATPPSSSNPASAERGEAAPPLAEPRAPEAVGFERWYVLTLQGQRAGSMQVYERPEGGQIRSGSAMKLVIKRGEARVPMEFASEWVETSDGRPVSLSSTTVMGAEPVKKVYRFDEAGVELRAESGGRVTTSRLPRPPGEWSTPAAATRAVAAALEKHETRIVTRTLEETFSGGLAVMTATRSVAPKPGEVEVLGKVVPGLKWTVRNDLYPQAVSEEWVDTRGQLLRGTVDLGMLKLEQLAADRALAQAEIDAPELLVSTLVRPDRPIPRPRQVKRGEFVLRVDEGPLEDLPNSSAQRTERLDERSLRVSVDADGPPAWIDLVGGEEPKYRAASTMVNHEDPEIARLARQAVRDAGRSSAEQAEAARRFVQRYIRAKGLDVGFASASEVARTRSGDCTEHGVLLAGLLRALGIPARVASGLIYAEEFQGRQGVFGYHLWAQAWLAPAPGAPARWVDLDATLPGPRAFDATHILLGTSALGDDQFENTMVKLAPLMGRLKIKVERIEP
jgi:transglutaminase-like putative cysteine protease